MFDAIRYFAVTSLSHRLFAVTGLSPRLSHRRGRFVTHNLAPPPPEILGIA
ncbi:MAG: hypothetical protein MJE68_07405 [Proteobacteria bacterium]|nr:hypothetical protein [Pseudomonadota bacterium]